MSGPQRGTFAVALQMLKQMVSRNVRHPKPIAAMQIFPCRASDSTVVWRKPCIFLNFTTIFQLLSEPWRWQVTC